MFTVENLMCVMCVMYFLTHCGEIVHSVAEIILQCVKLIMLPIKLIVQIYFKCKRMFMRKSQSIKKT